MELDPLDGALLERRSVGFKISVAEGSQGQHHGNLFVAEREGGEFAVVPDELDDACTRR